MNDDQPPPSHLAHVEIHVVRAELALEPSTDPRAPGGEVTRALCGHWEHEPPCRWPHNNTVAGTVGRDDGISRFRTVFVAPAPEVAEVRARIEAALRSDARWRTLEVTPSDLDAAERTLGELMRAGKRRAS